MTDPVADDPEPPFGRQELLRLWREHRDRGAATYADAQSKLWLGNGAGAVAALSAMGAAASAKLPLHKWFIVCPGAFVLGLVLLGIGTLITLVHEARWLNAHEEAEGILDLRVDFIQRPTDEIGLAWFNPRTLAAISSAIMFLIGVVAGGVAVLQALPL